MRLSSKWMAVAAVAWLGVAVVAAGNDDLRLIEAIQDQDHEAVRALLSEKVDVNTAEGDGATALHWAVVRDDARWWRRCSAPAPTRTPPTTTA